MPTPDEYEVDGTGVRVTLPSSEPSLVPRRWLELAERFIPVTDLDAYRAACDHQRLPRKRIPARDMEPLP